MTDEVVPYELGFRYVYGPLLQAGTMTAALRPDDRRLPNQKGVEAGMPVIIRLLRRPGIPELGIEPLIEPLAFAGVITTVTVKPLSEFTREELAGCSPDSQTWQLGAYQLGLIYNRVFTKDDLVTLIHFRYTTNKEGNDEDN